MATFVNWEADFRDFPSVGPVGIEPTTEGL